MKSLSTTTKGATALSTLALLTELWRSFLDAMFAFPVDYAGKDFFQNTAAVIFTLLFAGWAWALIATARGSRAGLVTAFTINALVLVAIPVSWLFVYCPAACRAGAGIFDLANTLNLVFGLLAAISLGFQFRRKEQRGGVLSTAIQG